jgi:hypothetical protein
MLDETGGWRHRTSARLGIAADRHIWRGASRCKTCLLLTNALEGGVSIAVKNKDLGDITIDARHTGKGGCGLRHIIEWRYKKTVKAAMKLQRFLSR